MRFEFMINEPYYMMEREKPQRKPAPENVPTWSRFAKYEHDETQAGTVRRADEEAAA